MCGCTDADHVVLEGGGYKAPYEVWDVRENQPDQGVPDEPRRVHIIQIEKVSTSGVGV